MDNITLIKVTTVYGAFIPTPLADFPDHFNSPEADIDAALKKGQYITFGPAKAAVESVLKKYNMEANITEGE